MDAGHLKEEYTAISDSQIEFLNRVARAHRPGSDFVKIDVSALYRKEFGGCPNEDAYCSPYTLLRLLADELPELPDKLLYLDTDILFNRDIRLLYNTDVEGYEYAATRDHYGKYLIHPRYINAGVLLLNLKEMRKTGILKRARALLRKKNWSLPTKVR